MLNTGVAPCYHNYAPVVRLENASGCWDIPLNEDIRRWMRMRSTTPPGCFPSLLPFRKGPIESVWAFPQGSPIAPP